MRRNLEKTPIVVEQMKDVLSFLRRRGIVHFDSHDHNILTDGSKLFLTDFGLVSDKSFELSERERVLLRENRYYDCGEFLCNFIDYAQYLINKLPAKKQDNLKSEYGLDDDALPRSTRTATLLDSLEQICADGWLKLPRTYLDVVAKHRDAILIMEGFFERMWGTNRKNYAYDRTRLRRLLAETGVIES